MTNPFDFSRRQTGPDEKQTQQMLQAGQRLVEAGIDLWVIISDKRIY